MNISHSEKAFELFNSGYNCSQAVFGAFADDLGVDTETAMKLASSFGGGMGRMREVCGAVSGMFMAAGVLFGYSDPEDRTAKTEHYKRIQELAAEFKKENGSIVCRELLGLNVKTDSYIPEERTEQYYKKRPCGELVRMAAQILDDYINKNINGDETHE